MLSTNVGAGTYDVLLTPGVKAAAASPGGSSGDIQYNNAGSFGGFTPGTGVVTFLGTPSSANLRSALTDETGTGAAVFGTSPFLSGTATISGATTTGPDFEVSVTGDTNSRIALGVNTTDVARLSMGPGNAVRDLFLERLGAASLRFGAPDAASPVAQNLSVQNVVAGTSNTAGASFTFSGSRGTGTGAGGSIVFKTAAAGGSGSSQNALATALTLGPDLSATFGGAVTVPGLTTTRLLRNVSGVVSNSLLSDDGTNTSLTSGALRGPDGTAAAPTYSFSGDTGLGFYKAGTSRIDFVSGSSSLISFDAANTLVRIVGGNTLRLGNSSSDAALIGEGFGILALRNSTNAQTFRFYASYTDASNYTRGALSAATGSPGSVTLAAESAGTGSANVDVVFTPKGTGATKVSSGGLSFQSSGGGGLLFPAGDAGSGSIASVSGGSNFRWGDSGSSVVFNAAIKANQIYPLSAGGGDLGSASLPFRQLFIDATVTAAGTTGDRTINKAAGTVNIAAGNSSVTVTSNKVTASSIVSVMARTNDATCQVKNYVAAAGSFTVNMTAACTTETSVGFHVINQ